MEGLAQFFEIRIASRFAILQICSTDLEIYRDQFSALKKSQINPDMDSE